MEPPDMLQILNLKYRDPKLSRQTVGGDIAE